MDRNLYNIVLLGICFMLVFAAFQTMGNIEKIILDSIKFDDPSFTANGYVSLSIIYTVFSLSNWLVPSVITILGPKTSLFIGGIAYVFFITMFLIPKTWLVYTSSAILGFGAALIWTAQGHFLTINSNSDTISRNTGIFWTLLQLSMFFGNTLVFIKFYGLEKIDLETRRLIFWVLSCFASFGVLCMLGLKKINVVEPEDTRSNLVLSKTALEKSLKLFSTKKMMLLSVTSIYTGIELSFYSGVYGTCVSYTSSFGKDAKKLVGLSGILVGAGEVLGGAIFGLMGKRIKYSRAKIFFIGALIHLIAFIIIFLDLPNKSPLEETTDTAILKKSSPILALACSFLLGLGDSIINTQLISCLSNTYSTDSVSAFAIFKFTQSIAAAICFFYSSYFGLYLQLVILTIVGIAGTSTFIYANKLASYYNSEELKQDRED